MKASQANSSQSGDEKRLVRLPERGVVSGVAAGFADYFNLDVTVMRLIFIAITFASSGFGLVAYLVLWVVMPVDGDTTKKSISPSEASEGASGKLNSVQFRYYAGLGIIGLGLWMLLATMIPGFFSLQMKMIWPIALIVFGIWLIASKE